MKIENLQQKIENSLEFETYFNELIAFNSKINLTAITEKREVYIKHFLDSVLPIDEIKTNATVVDVGTGAGFPGVPIKILRPDVRLTLVDSLNKRINFLNDVCSKLNFKTNLVSENLQKAENMHKNEKNIQKNNKNIANSGEIINLVHARAEDFCKTNRESFDVAVARAVAKLNTLAEYLLPLVKPGGIVLAYKGANVQEELAEAENAIKILGGEYVKTLSFTLPENLGERQIVVIKKQGRTPKIYPRPQNKPKTNPIK